MNPINPSLKQAILDWDGKSADDIDAVYALYKKEISLLDDLTTFMADESLQSGATWLIKHHFDNKGTITTKQTLAIYQQLPTLKQWPPCLHILQSMGHLPIDETVKVTVELFLRRCLADKNKFVRAWSYNGLHLLQQQYPEYKEEVQGFFDLAMQDEAASVKARIRSLLKEKRSTRRGPSITNG